MDVTDRELLKRFQENQCEDSFRQLVAHHAAMVIATARRVLGDQHQAEEIAQSVFMQLARKAVGIKESQSLAGWLYIEARHRAMDSRRAESRRINREQLALTMHSGESIPPASPLTEERESALAGLQPDERDVLLLRYLEDRQLREVGQELGISEQAAQKRVARALDRLRDVFSRRGITIGTGAVAALLINEAGAAVPPAFITSVTTAALGLTAAATATSTITTTTMNLLNLKTSAAILSAIVITGTTTYLIRERVADRLREDARAAEAAQARLTDAQAQSLAAIRLKNQQIEQLRKDVGDLPRLRGEIDRLNRELESMAKLKVENADLKKRLATTPAPMPAPSTEPDAQAYDLSEFVPRGKWRNAGLATPDDTIMTLQWATLSHDGQAVLSASSYPPDLLEKMRQHLTGPGFQNETNPAEAVRILAKIPMGTTKMVVQLEERMYDGTTLKRPVTLVQEADGWKATVTDLGMGTPIGRRAE